MLRKDITGYKTQVDSSPLISSNLEQLHIDYITYTRYSDQMATHYTSDKAFMNDYLEDENSILPIEICRHSTILTWDRICSPRFLNQCTHKYRYNRDGFIILLYHHNLKEQISVGTKNKEIDTIKDISKKTDLIQIIINNVHSSISNHKQQLSQSTYKISQILLKNRNQIHTTQAPSTNYTLQKKHYIHGNVGGTYLTAQEFSILQDILKLQLYTEIASKNQVSPKTVASHLTNIKRKLGASTKSDLYRIAKNNALVPFS